MKHLHFWMLIIQIYPLFRIFMKISVIQNKFIVKVCDILMLIVWFYCNIWKHNRIKLIILVCVYFDFSWIFEKQFMRNIIAKSGVLVLIKYIIFNHYFQHWFIMRLWTWGFAGSKFYTDWLIELVCPLFWKINYWKWFEKGIKLSLYIIQSSDEVWERILEEYQEFTMVCGPLIIFGIISFWNQQSFVICFWMWDSFRTF